MAIEFNTPPYSFLQANEPVEACTWIERPCLPVFALSDLQFQVFASVDGIDKDTFEGQNFNAGVTLDCDRGFVDANFTGNWHKYETGVYGDPDKWVGYFIFFTSGLFETYPVGQCFAIKVFSPENLGYALCFDTCFTKIAADCFTSVLQYKNDWNVFGFINLVPTYNRVRLYFYPHSAIDTEESKDYSKSDGSTVQLYYRLWRDYKIKFDYHFDYMFERITIGLSHTDVRITSEYAALNQEAVVKIDKVDIAWKEDETPQFNMAQGSTTIRLSAPRANVNSNCG